jgi:WhiB family transcriptional regulator, redox-sensing transcriptional regulator
VVSQDVAVIGSRQAAVLAHLENHPDLTACELARALGLSGQPYRQLARLEQMARVVSATAWDPASGREVTRWRIAPPGTVPPPAPPADLAALERRRERDRLSQRARRALSPPRPGPPPVPRLPGAACRSADPELFFGPESERVADWQRREAEAKAVCAACPVTARCLAYALETRQAYGIWGGAAESERRAMLRQADRRAS